MTGSVRILGIDPGLRVGGFGFGRALRALDRLRRSACAETRHPVLRNQV